MVGRPEQRLVLNSRTRSAKTRLVVEDQVKTKFSPELPPLQIERPCMKKFVVLISAQSESFQQQKQRTGSVHARSSLELVGYYLVLSKYNLIPDLSHSMSSHDAAGEERTGGLLEKESSSRLSRVSRARCMDSSQRGRLGEGGVAQLGGQQSLSTDT